MSERPGPSSSEHERNLKFSAEFPDGIEDAEVIDKVTYSDEFPNGIEDAVVVEDGSADANAEKDTDTPEASAENPNTLVARDGLLRTHALRQNALEAATAGVEGFRSVINTAQDVRSAARSFRLRARESRSQRKLERQSNKAENSMFAFRRRKFARKAEQTKATLEGRTAELKGHNNFITKRQESRDASSREIHERVNNNREFLLKQSLVARERRQRRHELWESRFTLIESRSKELREKRAKQVSMVEFRQALFNNLQEA